MFIGMNDLTNSHENIEKINDKLLAESFSILESTLDLYQAEEIIEDESKEGSFDIFSQSFPDALYHNFDHLPDQAMNTDAHFSESSQITSFDEQDGEYSCKSKIGSIPMFDKMWPDQLDILAGPLLEGDDDTYSDCHIPHKYSLNNEVNLTTKCEQDLILNNSVSTGIETKTYHIDSINYIKKKNVGIKLGSIVRISKDEDNGEEIDVVTVDDDSSSGDISLDNQNYFKVVQNVNVSRECSNFCPNTAVENNIGSCTTETQSCLSGNRSSLTKDVKNAVLEAPDLNSLLEQFEATEDSFQSGKQVVDSYNKRLTESTITLGLTPKGCSTTSLIKKIKSSRVPSRSTIMISHETVLKSTSPSRLKIDNNMQLNNITTKKSCIPISRTLKELSVSSSDNCNNIINYSDDHDYCSPFPSSGIVPYYSKIPEYLTELKPKRNAGKNTILKTILSRKDKIDNIYCVEDATTIASSPLSSASNVLEDESLSSISSGFSEASTNSKCQLLENTDTKESQPSPEVWNVSDSPELQSCVGNSVDFQSKFRHDQHLTEHCSSSIGSSPSHSPPPKWLPLRRSRSRSPSFGKHKLNRIRNGCRQHFTVWEHKEKVKQIEERRVLYVGNIPEGTTRADLQERFGKFGPIHEVSIHIRDFDDNYAFVTFGNRNDAYMAVEHGNDDPNLPKLELSFGGRRQFCKVRYADLDSQYNANERRDFQKNCNDLDFDSLLKSVKAQFKSNQFPQS